MEDMFKNRNTCFLLLTFIFLLAVSGCEKEHTAKVLPQAKHDGPLFKESIQSSLVQVPIQLKSENFYEISGWLDDYTIVYITESSESSNVYSYDLRTGKSQLLYENQTSIVSLEISPSGDYILIHSSPATNHGQIIILDNQGKVINVNEIPSAEIAYEWNPFDENTVLISAFSEDWEFSTYQLKIVENALLEISIPQPFAYWIEKGKLLYLDWDESTPSFFAPLIEFSLDNKEHHIFVRDVYQVDTFGGVLMTISVEEADQENATYTFYTQTYEKVTSFSIPHLSRFSDWLIPYYDFNRKKDLFITFQPEYSSEEDLYGDGFTLMAYDLKSKEKETILENMENEPIRCSPNGSLCLVGHYFEKLLDLSTKEIVSLIED